MSTDLATATAENAPAVDRLPADPPPRELAGQALQAAARDAWLADRRLSGAELAGRFGRSERWGRDRIAEARQQPADPPAGGLPPPTGAIRPGSNGSTARVAGISPAPGTAAHSAARAPAGAVRQDRRHDRQSTEVPRSLVVITVIAVVVVAVVTMVTSYTHTHDLAQMAGQAWLAKILPAAVDGLVIAGSTSLLVDRRRGGRGHPLAWAAVVIGLSSSMAANVVAVDPTLVDLRVARWVMAGYAPVALAVSGHLLLRMLGEQPTT